jgi:hypothetical protein
MIYFPVFPLKQFFVSVEATAYTSSFFYQLDETVSGEHIARIGRLKITHSILPKGSYGSCHNILTPLICYPYKAFFFLPWHSEINF